MRFISSLFLISFTLFAAESKLKVLKTKQSLNNIRFISSNGKFTYFQKRSGELLLSKNYKNLEVLTNKSDTEYFIYSSISKKNLIIEVDDSFNSIMSYLKMNKLFIVPYGTEKATEIGEGKAPKLHLDDQYFSLFNPKEKSIEYYNLSSSKKVFTVKLANSLNPFYIPETSMLTNYDIIYTDINQEGQNAIIWHSILDKKSQTIYKSSLSGGKLEYCLMDKKLYIGEFSFGDIPNPSKIVEIPLYNNEHFKNSNILYQTQQSDIGNMNCMNNKIFFIKTLSYNKGLNLKSSEVAMYDLKENKTTVLSDLKYVTQIIRLDDLLVAPFRGEYYLVQGEANLIQDGIKKDEAIDKRDLEFK